MKKMGDDEGDDAVCVCGVDEQWTKKTMMG